MDNLDICTFDAVPTQINNVRATHVGANCGYSYYNFTGKPIYVTGRNGIIIKINPTFIYGLSGKFIIRYNLLFDKDENITIPVNSPEEDVVKVFNDSFVSSTESNYISQRAMHYDCVFDLKDIEDNDGAIYIRNLDILLSTDKTVEIAIHPFSEIANKNRAIKRIKDSINEYTNFCVRIVDNTGKLPTQYIKVAGRVLAIAPIRDIKAKNGVYVLENKLVDGANSRSRNNVAISKLSQHRVHSKERKEPIIFKRYEDALNFNDLLEKEKMEYEQSINEFRKLELAYKENELAFRQNEKEFESSIKLKEMEFKEEEIKLRKEIMEMDIKRKRDEEIIDSLKRESAYNLSIEKNKLAEKELEIKKLQQEYSVAELKLKKELLELKEEYEKLANFRRNVTDTLKAIPVLITGSLAVAALFSKGKD